MLILELDISGVPRSWLTIKEAVEHIAKDKVKWSLGDPIATFRGGFNNEGEQSIIAPPSIIAVTGTEFSKQKRHPKITLTNDALFERDHFLCAYCGEKFGHKKLSRDHIIPVSRGGKNIWMNVVTSCRPCNTKKDDQTPEEAKMKLLFLPYEPSHWEALILRNRNILDDQMEYLLTRVSPNFLKRQKIVEKLEQV